MKSVCVLLSLSLHMPKTELKWHIRYSIVSTTDSVVFLLEINSATFSQKEIIACGSVFLKLWSASTVWIFSFDMESFQRQLPPNPSEKANFLSIVFFMWTIPLFKKGYYKVLQLNDIFQPLTRDKSKVLGDQLEAWVIR